MKIHEEKDIEIKSDHNLITLTYDCNRGKNNTKVKERVEKGKQWKRKNVEWPKFKEKVEEGIPINGENVQQTLEKIQTLLRWAGEKTVGYKKNCKVNYKPWWSKKIKETRQRKKKMQIRKKGK